jgi:hypothetical protein
MASLRAVVLRAAHFASGAPLDSYAERRSSLLACWRSLSLLAVTGFVFTGGGLGPLAANAQPTQPTPVTTISRPFPFVELQFGDVPIAIPKEWLTFLNLLRDKDGNVSSIAFANAHLRPRPRSPYYEIPPLFHFDMKVPAPELAAKNIAEKKRAIDARWSDRRPDQYGFWNWKTREYLLTETVHPRPLDQPLIVGCMEAPNPGGQPLQLCTVWVYWTLNTSVRYTFYERDVPESKWVELDQRVLELLRFLDGREPYSVAAPPK